MGRYCTNAEQADIHYEGIVYLLPAKREWPDREFMPEDKADALRDRIINYVQGIDKVLHSRLSTHLDYKDELEVGK